MGKILQQYIEDTKADFRSRRVVYCPNSIYHGCQITGPCSHEKMEIGRLNDFIEWLFEVSEHRDHISQSEAWAEFEEYEFKNSDINKNKEGANK